MTINPAHHKPRLRYEILKDFDPFLEHLRKLEGFDLQPADFEPYDLGILRLAIVDQWSFLSSYLWSFRLDPDRSGQFTYGVGKWSADVVTQCMKYLRTLFESR